jgi:iron dependent repressor
VAPAVEGGGRRRATVITLLDEGAARGAAPAGASEAVIPDGSLWLLG